ncbi:MAG: helix-turn-helix domain-containing protein [Cyanobacteria bacterium P01_H01_bin.74]
MTVTSSDSDFKNKTLPDTLAQRLQFLRDERFFSVKALANKVQVDHKVIEDIEAGLVLFLAPALRQRLARVLHVSASVLFEVEKRNEDDVEATAKNASLALHNAILIEPEAEHLCPTCAAPLIVQVFERRDFNDKPLMVLKVHCSKCLFRLTDD